jgi:hypothetical protein
VRESPVARATTSRPPRPSAIASLPAHTRVIRSSKCPRSNLKRLATSFSFLVAIATFDHAAPILSIPNEQVAFPDLRP